MKVSAKGCEYTRAPPGAISGAGNGDSILIAAADPVALVQTARHRMDEVYAAPGQPRLRIALHHGEVHTRQRDSDLQREVAGGSARRCGAPARCGRRPAASCSMCASPAPASLICGCGCTGWNPERATDPSASANP